MLPAVAQTALLGQQCLMWGALTHASHHLRTFSGAAAQAKKAPADVHHTGHQGWVDMFPTERQETELHIFKLKTGQNVAAHPSMKKDFDSSYLLSQPAYTRQYMESVAPIHKPPEKAFEYAGLGAIKVVRSTFDFVTGWNRKKLDEATCLQRIIFLETVAGVPGMVAGMLRHMRSLRSMKRDHGWIHTLLEEAENERMHLLVHMQMRKPGLAFRSMVLLAQGVFFNLFFTAYLISPKFCHSFVGYLEEEAVKTYSKILEEIDAGRIWKDAPAPELGKLYWRLGDKATYRDVILATRADEQCHSTVNHTLANTPPDDPNPFNPASSSTN